MTRVVVIAISLFIVVGSILGLCLTNYRLPFILTLVAGCIFFISAIRSLWMELDRDINRMARGEPPKGVEMDD